MYSRNVLVFCHYCTVFSEIVLNAFVGAMDDMHKLFMHESIYSTLYSIRTVT